MATGMAVGVRRSSRGVALAAAAAACLLAAVASLGPVDGATARAGRDRRPVVRVLAGVPGERVDASVDGRRAVRGLRYGHVSDDVPVDRGAHVVSLTITGRGEDAGHADVQVRVAPDRDVTVARYLDASGLAQVGAFPVDRSPVREGDARVVVRHLAALPRGDVRRDGRVIVAGLRNGRTATKVVRPGRSSFDVVLAGQTDRLVEPMDLALRPARVVAVSVVGSARGDDVAVVVEDVPAAPAPPPTTTSTPASLAPASSDASVLAEGTTPAATSVRRVPSARTRAATTATTATTPALGAVRSTAPAPPGAAAASPAAAPPRRAAPATHLRHVAQHGRLLVGWHARHRRVHHATAHQRASAHQRGRGRRS
jgi:hypothetical protein